VVAIRSRCTRQYGFYDRDVDWEEIQSCRAGAGPCTLAKDFLGAAPENVAGPARPSAYRVCDAGDVGKASPR